MPSGQQQQQESSSQSDQSDACSEFDTCQKLILGFLLSTLLILTLIIAIRCYLRKYRKQKQVIVQIRPINVSNLLRIQLSQSLALKSLHDQSEIKGKEFQDLDQSQNGMKNPNNRDNNSECQFEDPNQSIINNLPIQKSVPLMPRSRILSSEFQNQRFAIKQNLRQSQQGNISQQQQLQQEEVNSNQKLKNESDNVLEFTNDSIKLQRKYNTIQVNLQESNNNFPQITKSEVYLTSNNHKIVPASSSVQIQSRKNKLLNNFCSLKGHTIDQSLQIPETQE